MNFSKAKIKILIVDDSMVIQKLLSTFISKQPDFEIIGVCSDPFQASQILTDFEVDCMILDLELPKMDGVTFLKKLSQTFKVNTIVLSGLVSPHSNLKDKLIALGAADALSKPNGHDNEGFFNNLFASIRRTKANQEPRQQIFNAHSELLIIASSTGSTENIRRIMIAYENPPTTIIVQHMGTEFTNKFAKSMNLLTQFEISEAQNSTLLQKNHAYIAPGNFHLKVSNDGKNYCFELSQDSHVHGVRPSADITMLTLPTELAKNTTVVVLSGMGKDGAAGLAHLKKLGATTIAESEKTSVVFGMPKAAIETGFVDQILDFDQIVDYLVQPKNQRTG